MAPQRNEDASGASDRLTVAGLAGRTDPHRPERSRATGLSGSSPQGGSGDDDGSAQTQLTHEVNISEENRDALTVELFVRGSSAAPLRIREVIDALEALHERGLIGAVDIHSWPGAISLVTNTDPTVVETFEQFRAWADEHERTICPPFLIREFKPSITSEADTILITPVLCLAVYVGEELLGVYPCSHGDSITTVDDCIDRLSTDGEPARTRTGDRRREEAGRR